MERMKLQRHLADVLAEEFYVQHGQKFDEFKLADAVLAALGLDDLDAAVKRMARAYEDDFPQYEDGVKQDALRDARRALDAALSPLGCVDCGGPLRGEVLRNCTNPACGMFASTATGEGEPS